jgi:DNA invertase Pin-like site-specific DNA recombinase
MEDVKSLLHRIEILEERVERLESAHHKTPPERPGRKPLLNDQQKAEVRRKHNMGVSYSALAAEYSVSKTTICNICHLQNDDTSMIVKRVISKHQMQGGGK